MQHLWREKLSRQRELRNPFNPSEEPPAQPGPLGIIRGFFLLQPREKGSEEENLGSSGKKLQVREVLREKRS